MSENYYHIQSYTCTVYVCNCTATTGLSHRGLKVRALLQYAYRALPDPLPDTRPLVCSICRTAAVKQYNNSKATDWSRLWPPPRRPSVVFLGLLKLLRAHSKQDCMISEAGMCSSGAQIAPPPPRRQNGSLSWNTRYPISRQSATWSRDKYAKYRWPGHVIFPQRV